MFFPQTALFCVLNISSEKIEVNAIFLLTSGFYFMAFVTIHLRKRWCFISNQMECVSVGCVQTKNWSNLSWFPKLTHSAIWLHVALEVLDHIGWSVNWTNVGIQFMKSGIIHLRAIPLQIDKVSITKLWLRITFSKTQFPLTGNNVLNNYINQHIHWISCVL